MMPDQSPRHRRDFLKLGLAGALAGLGGERCALADGTPVAQVGPAPAPAAPTPPAPSLAQSILDLARQMAKQPFKAPKPALPDVLANLTYDQYVTIRARPGSAIWINDNIGFAIEPLHRGFIFTTPMDINLVENGAPQHLPYNRAAFDFDKLQFPADMPDIGYSGFRVLQQIDGGNFVQVAIFQGASFFRAMAHGQNLGVTARGLSIRTADPAGEEFPMFRNVWIEKPTPAANALVIHALLDSQSTTGAFRFTLRPGEATIIDIELTLCARAAIDNFGIAAMSATYLLGSMDRRRSEDVRPNVYEVDGLQILTGKGEWLWRPVSNRETLQVSAFTDQNPRGFGLLQRSRMFETFEDDEAHWELRPSLWIEPIGDWADGEVVLIEIPAESENNDNVIASWRPKAPIAAGAEVSFAYRQFWCWQPPERPALAIATTERTGKIGKNRRFIVQFTGDVFADPQRFADIKPNLTAKPGQVGNVRTFVSRDRKHCRIVFDLDPGSEAFSEVRLVLEQSGKPVSETWLYRWTP
jgi:glucans biosynthesis protein